MDETTKTNEDLKRALFALLVSDTARELSEWCRMQKELGAEFAPGESEEWAVATPQAVSRQSVVTPVNPPVSTPQVTVAPQADPLAPIPQAPKPNREPQTPASTTNRPPLKSPFASFVSLRSEFSNESAEVIVPEEAKATLDKNVRNCRLCSLGARRQDVLCGYGPLDAKIMFVGAGGNPHELEENHLMTGEAAQKLDDIIAAMAAINPEATKDRIYFSNVIKCAAIPAPQQRKQVATTCLRHLREEIRIIQPQVIVVWGQTAYSAMFGDDTNIITARGQVRHFEQVATIATHHPMEMLKNAQLKKFVWNDIRTALHLLKK